MNKQPKRYLVGLLVFFGVVAILAVIGAMTAEQKPYVPRQSAVAAVPHGPAEFKEVFAALTPLEGLERASKDQVVRAAGPTLSYYPCQTCHQPGSFKRESRKLAMHQEIQSVLQHGPKDRWCLDCHDFQDRNSLHLLNGTKLTFNDSYLLCAQCHGTIYRDWNKGIHGKRTGYWNGPKRATTCVSCHSPHSPRFHALKPLPPPVRPEFYRPNAAKRAVAEKNSANYGHEAPARKEP